MSTRRSCETQIPFAPNAEKRGNVPKPKRAGRNHFGDSYKRRLIGEP
jgi:hypothetical protein